MQNLKRVALVILAGLFLIEAWLWEQFVALGRVLVSYFPYETLKSWVAGKISALPPPAVVPIFILPILVILPFKLFGLWLIGHHHHFILGGLVFLAAKMAGLAVTAFLYDLTKDKLMMMKWFRIVAAKASAVKVWAHDFVAPYKAVLRARITALKSYFPQARGSFVALALRLRKQMSRVRS